MQRSACLCKGQLKSIISVWHYAYKVSCVKFSFSGIVVRYGRYLRSKYHHTDRSFKLACAPMLPNYNCVEVISSSGGGLATDSPSFMFVHGQHSWPFGRIITFKIKQIPFCYILTNFERWMNAERHMYNIEKDTGGIREVRFLLLLLLSLLKDKSKVRGDFWHDFC